MLHWLVEAAEQLRAFSAYFLCDLHLEQLQLDELDAVLRDLKAGAISEDEAMQRLEHSPYWVWTALDPKSKLQGWDLAAGKDGVIRVLEILDEEMRAMAKTR